MPNNNYHKFEVKNKPVFTSGALYSRMEQRPILSSYDTIYKNP